MTKHYSFECYDDEGKVTTRVELKTENVCWDGYDAPMHQFFNFLKGCGFVFGTDTEIGVRTGKGNFRSATPD